MFAFSFLALSSLGCYAGGSNQVREARLRAERAVAPGAASVALARAEFLVRSELETRRERLEEARSTLEDVRLSQAATARALDQALSTVQVMEQDLKAAQERKAAIQEELAAIRELAARLATAQAERQRLIDAIAAARAGVDELLGRAAEARSELARVRERDDVLQAVRGVLRRALEAIEPPAPSEPAPVDQPPESAGDVPDGKS